MKQRIFKLFFMISLLVSLPALAMMSQEESALYALNKELNNSLVYINSRTQASILELENLLPHHQWSTEFKDLCQDIKDEGNVAQDKHVAYVINECLEACKNLSCDQEQILQTTNKD
ncbi:MAG: hypothetical protein NTX86_02555 [Candidatus Dependentiae bacterium]|nr:hypothetical protein [Candidatus Dependentiae bacterium]